MSVQPASRAPLLVPDDPELVLPPSRTTLFTRHLPPPKLVQDAERIRTNRMRDYAHLHARLTEALGHFGEMLVFHQIEFVVLAGKVQDDGAALIGYVADLGHWCHSLEALMAPEVSAVPRSTWYRGRP